MDGLTTLRLEVVQSLLEECTSVKVKRMFLYLADLSAHPWRSELKDAQIKLGSGKGVLVPEGRLDQRYLTAPANPRHEYMSSDLPYRDQVSLMLPIVGREKDFALKGGTAINLFVRDLSRLSVDIDLTILPLSDRAVALVAIHDGMARLARSSSSTDFHYNEPIGTFSALGHSNSCLRAA